MLNRILIGILGIPLLISVLLYGGLPLLLFVNIIILLGIYEFFKMGEESGKRADKVLGYIFAILIPNLVFFLGSKYILSSIVLLLILLIGKKVIQNKVEGSSESIGFTLLGVVYISVFFTHILLINNLKDGGKWILAIQILVWLCDSFAYFVGIGLGRKIFKKGFSEISPKKSIEGSIGGIFFAVVGLYLLNIFFIKSQLVWYQIIIFGVVLSLVAQIGDLGESMFKREFKIKDSGKLLGEHGGILDRFDSMLFVIPIAYYILTFIL